MGKGWKDVDTSGADGGWTSLMSVAMVDDDHKEELYAWLHDKLSNLRVVLIANRIDSRDRERLRACQRLRHEDDSTLEEAKTVVLLEARVKVYNVKCSKPLTLKSFQGQGVSTALTG